MKILIDTHALLWLITEDKKLSIKSSKLFMDPNNKLYFSIASFWEICIKVSVGKLKLSKNWDQIIKDEISFNNIKILPILETHCLKIIELPLYHRDPFDRIIISQATVEQMHIMSANSSFSQYDIEIIW